MQNVKTVPASYSVKTDEESGGWIVEGYASIFDARPDSYGDVVKAGSFKKTITEQQKSGRPRFFWDHQQPLGKILSLEEDAKGLKIRARISKTALGHDVKTLVEDGAVGEFSYGYDLVGEEKNKPNEYGGVDITEVRLHEVSLVGMAALPEAVVTGIKSARDETRYVRAELAELRKSLGDPRYAGYRSAAKAAVEEEEGDADAVKVGDSVSWNSSGGSSDTDSPPAGKVVSIHTDGPVPDIDADVMGTEDEPAARIRVWSQDGSPRSEAGAWSPTDTYVGHKVATLKPRPSLQEEVSGGGEKSAALLLKAREVIEELKDALQANAEEPSEGISGTPHREDTPLGAMEPQKDAELYRKFREELDSMKCITDTEEVHPQQKGTI